MIFGGNLPKIITTITMDPKWVPNHKSWVPWANQTPHGSRNHGPTKPLIRPTHQHLGEPTSAGVPPWPCTKETTTCTAWMVRFVGRVGFLWWLHSLKLTAKAPENRPGPKRKRSYSNHPFSGAMLVSGRVYTKLILIRWIFITFNRFQTQQR